MLIRLCRDSFVRCYENSAYIVNQLTHKDIVFNDTGKDFLSELQRTPQEINEIIKRLKKKYIVEHQVLLNDFTEFIENLESKLFITTGKDEKDLNLNEPRFSYKNKDFIIKSMICNDLSASVQDTESYFKSQNEFILKSVTLEVTRQCNERCIHCYIPNSQKKEGKPLSFKQAINYIDQAAEMGVINLTITGGEPFMNKDIERILLYARKKDFQIQILSNLTLLNSRIVNVLKHINPSIIQVSLYSMDAGTHDFITMQNGSFQKTKGAIETLIDNDIPLQISTPVMKYNVNDYKDVFLWAKNFGLKANVDINIMAQSDFNTDNLVHSPEEKQIKEIFQFLIKEDDQWRNDLINGYGKGKKTQQYSDNIVCGVGIDSLYISSEGKIFPCPSWQGLEIDDLNHCSLQHIWKNNDSIKKLRDIKIGDFREFVKNKNNEFMSVCMARNANANNGNYMKLPSNAEKIAKITKEFVDEFLGNDLKHLPSDTRSYC